MVGEKHDLKNLENEKGNIEFELRGMDFRLEKILTYLSEFSNSESSKRYINKIMTEKNPEARRKLIEDLVDKAFISKSFFSKEKKLRANPEIIAFFADYLEEHLILESQSAQKNAEIKEVIEETRKLLGDMKPHRTSKYMSAAGNHMQKQGSGEFKKESDNEKALLDYTDPENVLSYLADIHGTGDLSSPKNKKGVISSQQLDSIFMLLGGKSPERRVLTVSEKAAWEKAGIKGAKGVIGEKRLLQNISYIFNKAVGGERIISFQSKEDLYGYLKSNPSAKAKFIDFVEQRARMGIDLNELFMKPSTSLKRTQENKADIQKDPRLQSTVENIGRMMEGKLDNEIVNFEKKVKSATGPEKQVMQNALDYIKGNRKSIIESFRVKAGGGFFSWLRDFNGRETQYTKDSVRHIKKTTDHMSGVVGLDIGSEELDRKLQEYTKVFKHMDIDIGFGMIDGKPHIGVGPRFSGDQALSKNLSLKYTVGTYLIVPYAVLGVDYLLNRGQLESLKGMVGKDIDLAAAHSAGIIATISTVGGSVGAYWSRDKLRGIEVKKEHFEKVMTRICKLENISKTPEQIFSELQSSPEGALLKGDDKESLKIIVENIQKTIKSFDDFDSLTESQKRDFVENGMKKAFVNRSYEKALAKAEKEGWYFGGIFVGVNFWFGFLPSVSVLVDGKKITVQWKENADSKAMGLGKRLTGAGTYEMGDALSDSAKKIQGLMDNVSGGYSNVRMEDGKLVISMKSGTDPMFYIGALHYNPAIKGQIKYDGKQIIIGNVGMINSHYENTSRGAKLHLYLGGKGEFDCPSTITSSNSAEAKRELGGNNPSAMQEAGSSKEGVDMSSKFIDKELHDYLRQNVDKFLGFVWRHEGEYSMFMKAYGASDYSRAGKYLIKMLSKDKVIKDQKIKDLYLRLNILKDAKPGTEAYDNFAASINQVANIIMVDINTSDKIKSPEQRKTQADEYINDIFRGRNSINVGGTVYTRASVQSIVDSCLQNSQNFSAHKGMFLKLFGYQRDQYILTNSAKRLYYLLRPSTEFYSEREKAFDSVARNEGLDSQRVSTYRKQSYDKLSSGTGAWTTTTLDSSMGLFASYKLDKTNTRRLSSGFGFSPGGVAEIATNSVTGEKALVSVDENDIATKTWVVEHIIKDPTMKQKQIGLSKILGVNLSNNDFKNLLVNGNINIGGKKYTVNRGLYFGLHGLCANEGFFLTLDKVITPRGNANVRFGYNGDVMTYEPHGEQKSLFLGATVPAEGEKKETTTTPNPEGCQDYADVGGHTVPGVGGNK